MRSFHAPGHAPRLFLIRSEVHPHDEIPARAEGLEAALHRLGLSLVAPPAAIVQEGGYSVDVIGTLLEHFLTGWGEA
jgi:hypothetical protein